MNYRIIEKLESCKTTKSAKKILEKNGITFEEGFNKSYDFIINDVHYRVMKDKYDNMCKVIKYKTKTIDVIQSTLRLMKYGYYN